MRRCSLFAVITFLSPAMLFADESMTTPARIVVRDAESRSPLAARVYLRSEDGQWRFARSLDSEGRAVEYRKQPSPNSVEMHTSVSAHPFVIDLPQGKHLLTVERGKEYLPTTTTILVNDEDLKDGIAEMEVLLQRFSNISEHGWYSGETHVHRSLDELPTAMLAEDLNVTLPLTYWVTKSHTPPGQGDRATIAVEPRLIEVDPTHVIWPLNTEYEIFTVGDKRHMLGAVFALNHKSVLTLGAPPVRPIAQEVRAQGALLELDKHNWPWSMMIAPVMKVDLYELTNNHLWRTEFLFKSWAEPAPEYMQVERDADGLTERGWLEFTLQNYYALLNCGLRMRPTGGTATGVHPVPLGFGRVYVHLPDGFSYDAWMEGLNGGRSFVTTGPLLVAEFDGKPPGANFSGNATETRHRVTGWARSATPLTSIQIVSGGEVVQLLEPENSSLATGGYESRFESEVDVTSSTWLAVRCYEEPAKRIRFAHTAPVHIEVAGKPLRAKQREVQFLIERMKSELERNEGVLSAAELEEYREALSIYEGIAETAE